MKVFLKYEDNDDKSTHKTLKMTLPKSWKSGPTSRLLEQFVQSYNGGNEGQSNPLEVGSLHLSTRRPNNGDHEEKELKHIPSDGVVIETIPDREDVYICHGASRTAAEIDAEKQASVKKKKQANKDLARCVRYGCNNRFPKGGPYPPCQYHRGPPVFHETAKFWSCCPNKKAYDWDEFQRLPFCQTSNFCSEIEENPEKKQKQFLGGCDLREEMGGPKLKSIDDFNASRAAGGSEGAPVLERLRGVLSELGVENELFDQVLGGIQKDIIGNQGGDEEDAAVIDESVKVLGDKLKSAMKAIAVEQLRIK